MMKQYQQIRRSLPEDVLLLYRLGDFYELFFDDAKIAAGILDVALTKRNQTPMCGVPYHAAQGYIAKLIAAGKRVAICDQIGEAQPGRIVQREITQVISAGTVSDENMLESSRNHYLAAVCRGKKKIGFAFVDLSTGDFRLTELADTSALLDELARVSPAEILVSDEDPGLAADLAGAVEYDGYAFLYDQAAHILLEHFHVQSLDGFGCGEMTTAVGAAGAILHYLQRQLRRQVDHLRGLRTYHPPDYMILDAVSQANLEVVVSQGAGGREGTLLSVMDRTVTPMGARQLRDWLLHPLRDVKILNERLDFIEVLLKDTWRMQQIREQLRLVRDVERTVGRLSQGSGNARDLQALCVSLEVFPEIKELLRSLGMGLDGIDPPPPQGLVGRIDEGLHLLPELCRLLESALVDEPPALLKDGGIFRAGYDERLDELRSASHEGKKWLAELQRKEAARTGIKSLKIKFNSVFGYFIEITKSNLASVPEEYQRKQTMANAERYITPELKEMEGKILGADERARQLELELFHQLRAKVLEHLEPLQESARAIAVLDVMIGLADTARLYHYCRPELLSKGAIEISEGRHPVLDQNLAGEKFVPNDVFLDGTTNRLLVITGPNMAGKSTYIRQVALIVLMAQAGSFVPATSARIGVADRIFTRVGASDDLSKGQSTFMVEMNETANIVNNATAQSLVILDEIGRGTSTFDGLSIAWSVAEHLHDQIGCRTLFATHYHELTELAQIREGVQNFSVAVREWNDDIVFLRKIIPGPADQSYGIQVARLAGLPNPVIKRAKKILTNLEKAELSARGRLSTARRKPKRRKKGGDQGEEDPLPQLSFLDILGES